MEFSDVIAARRTHRQFQPSAIDDAQLQQLLSASLRGPAAGGATPWRHDAFVGPSEVLAFWRAAWPTRSDDDRPRRLHAAAIVVFGASSETYAKRYEAPPVSGSHGGPSQWPVDFGIVDASFSAMLFQLAAIDAGFGTWFFGFDTVAYAEAFATAPDTVMIGAVALGTPEQSNAKRRTTTVADVVRRPVQPT